MNKIPRHAQRVFQGKIFEVWQWEQKMFDGSNATFEMLRRPNTANVVATAGDKILICEQRQPNKPDAFLSLPGGRCEWEEDPLTAAKRELLEETGYESDDWELLQEQSPVNKMEWSIFTYIARNCRKTKEQHLDAGEEITTRLITFDEFLALPDHKDFYEHELSGLLLRARLDSTKRDELSKKISPAS